MSKPMHKLFGAIVAATLGLITPLVAIVPAHAAVTTSYTDFGLREIGRWVGKYQASTDGFSGGNPAGNPDANGVGHFRILKPSTNATVVAAYLTSAGADHQTNEIPRPPVTSLDGQNVDYYAKNFAGKWTNFLADVTPIVQNFMTTASGTPETQPWAGTKYSIPLVYEAVQAPLGLPTYSTGLGLTVIFSDPAMTHEASVVYYFGSSDSNGQNLQMNFDTLGGTPPSGSWLSIGSAWSQGGGQYSTVSIQNSKQPDPTLISSSAGNDDDSYIGDGVSPNINADTQWGLVTVGGVGDSTDLPATPDIGAADDELYSMDGFLAKGVNSLTMNTTNPSGDDNIFQVVLSVPFVVYRTAFFDTQGGTSVPSQNFPDSVTLPAAPSKDGYTFDGWFTDPSTGTALTGTTYTPAGNGNVTLYAHWTPAPVHSVVYDSQGGSLVGNGTYTGTINALAGNPTKTGYSFDGWFDSPSGGSRITAPYTPGTFAAITFYAHWTQVFQNVTFDTQGGPVVSGSTYSVWINSLPADPTRAGYTFNGWFTAPTGGDQVTAPYKPATFADVTIYAQWTQLPQVTHNLYYDAQGGHSDYATTYTGTISMLLGGPDKTDYHFEGWYTAPVGGTEVVAPYTPATFADITLYAHWSLMPKIVLFDTQGGSSVPFATYSGSVSSLPAAPTKAGYNFLGWFAAASGGSALSAPYTPASFADITLYAHWSAVQPVTHSVTYNSQGGSSVAGGTYTGTINTLPAAPTRFGYNFDGWFVAASGGSALTAPYTPATFADITLYAHWSKPTPISVTLVINGWAVGQYKFSSKLTSKVKAFLAANTGYTSAICTSYSQGPKASTAEKKAVKNRGTALCALVQQFAGITIDPSAVTSVIKTAKGGYSSKVVLTLTK